MKKILIILLAAAAILLQGCTLPQKTSTGDLLDSELDSKQFDTGESEGDDSDSLQEDVAGSRDLIPIVLYYQDGEGNLIPMTRKIEKQEGIARAAINGLIDSSLNREEIQYFGVYPVLPKGTEILGIKIANGTATIDFNKNLLNYDNMKTEKNIVASIVYTLTEFNTVENVKILINGYEQQTLEFDTDIASDLNRGNVMINAPEAVAKGAAKVDAYYLKAANDKFVYYLPVSVGIPADESSDTVDIIIRSLCEVKDREKLYTELPEATRLLNSTVDGNIVTLNLSSALKEYGGTARETAIVNQLLYSMKQIKGVERVKLLVNGGTDPLTEGTDISVPLDIPNTINDVIDME